MAVLDVLSHALCPRKSTRFASNPDPWWIALRRTDNEWMVNIPGHLGHILRHLLKIF